MKPFWKIILTGFLWVVIIAPSFGQYIRIEGRQFIDENDSAFYPVVCNYIVRYFYPADTSLHDTSSLFIFPESDAGEIECYGESTCDTQFYHNFVQLKEHMKFNTIRFFGATPVYADTAMDLPGFRVDAKQRLNDGGVGGYSHKYFLHAPFYKDSIALRIFSLIDRVLVQANRAGLKVILLAGGAKGKFYPVLDTLYPQFLSALSQHIANQSPQEARDAIMAYDLLNEPSTSNQTDFWGSPSQHSKSAVCKRVAGWYDAVKTNDPGHLITMGIEFPGDIMEYDINVLKLDFASAHHYPRKYPYEPDSQRVTTMVNRFHAMMQCLGNTSVMPFIVGETGFSARAGVMPANPGTDGDTLQQKQYADSTLRITRNCLGSGYSWWKYQDSSWGSPFEDHLGLMNSGICTPPCNTLQKPVIQAFKDFNWENPPVNSPLPDSIYFNPFNHPIQDSSKVIHGNFVDEHGNPIKDAVIYGKTVLFYDPQNLTIPIYSIHYTYSDSSGNFTIIPYDYDTSKIERGFIEQIWFSAPGAEKSFRYHYDKDTTVWNKLFDSITITLKQNRWNYDEEINGVTISDTGKTLRGWNSITLSNVVFDTGSSVSVNARTDIDINSSFETLTGSEATVECIPTFPLCPECIATKISSGFYNENSVINKQTPEVELSFIPDEDTFDFIIFPNPSNGLYKVDIVNSRPITDDFNIEIFGSLGVIAEKFRTKETTFEIDISNLQKGIYFIKISTEKDSQIKKIILQ